MIVDADALNALAKTSACLETPAGSRILTPHLREFQRLTGQPCSSELSDRTEQAAALCQRDTTSQTLVVLKGHQTLVTNGRQHAVNATGNPGMATGGTGDCLTGIIAALVAQKQSPWDAARLASTCTD